MDTSDTDIFTQICKRLRLAALRDYTTLELIAELESRGVRIEVREDKDSEGTSDRRVEVPKLP